ncbi:HAMP domain-containing histidine kinase [Clostridium niameyense]|uniref:histidine kinase n=2 Tax=Clostridium niameyense TaxID=1622073 RepID=A0A6M0RBH5_9CLOT|nr:HAMP domain-containing histidine kinase [Clostridium niameyense]
MIWIICILLMIIIVLLINNYSIKREIRNITIQLKDYNDLKSYKKIDVCLLNKDIENLAYHINNKIEMDIKGEIEQRHKEEELKSLIANISHDLRTPLTSIIGYIQMIKSKKISEEKQKEYLDIAEARAKSLQNLLSDFFQLSVIESLEYELEISYINLNRILCEVITSMYYDFTEKNITPDIRLPKENIIVLGNDKAIQRVIENLVGNIIKHSKGDVCINLEIDKNEAVLTTINTAKDLTNNDVNYIFNRFYKKDKSRNCNGNSTGLGLAIAKDLIEKMSGSISAKIYNKSLYIFCRWKIKT